jgi:hypothetical protein
LQATTPEDKLKAIEDMGTRLYGMLKSIPEQEQLARMATGVDYLNTLPHFLQLRKDFLDSAPKGYLAEKTDGALICFMSLARMAYDPIQAASLETGIQNTAKSIKKQQRLWTYAFVYAAEPPSQYIATKNQQLSLAAIIGHIPGHTNIFTKILALALGLEKIATSKQSPKIAIQNACTALLDYVPRITETDLGDMKKRWATIAAIVQLKHLVQEQTITQQPLKDVVNAMEKRVKIWAEKDFFPPDVLEAVRHWAISFSKEDLRSKDPLLGELATIIAGAPQRALKRLSASLQNLANTFH